jgi:hypothetical protein
MPDTLQCNIEILIVLLIDQRLTTEKQRDDASIATNPAVSSRRDHALFYAYRTCVAYEIFDYAIIIV